MVVEGPDDLVRVHVPDFCGTVISADGHMVALVAPTDAGDGVLVLKLAEFRNLAGAGGPDVDGAVETNSDDILARPVDQIKVEVVGELWGVKYLVRSLGDVAGLCELGVHRIEGALEVVPVGKP